MVLHLTWLVFGTDWGTAQGHYARITAFAIRAGHIRGTVIIAIAFPLIRCTGQFTIFIHYKAGLANANWLMASRLALFVALADEQGVVAGICTLAVLAALQGLGAVCIILTGYLIFSFGTCIVGYTFWIRFAFYIGSANVATGTAATWSVQDRLTKCVSATCATHCTRVGAVSLEAWLFTGTIRIWVALFGV